MFNFDSMLVCDIWQVGADLPMVLDGGKISPEVRATGTDLPLVLVSWPMAMFFQKIEMQR